MPRKKKTEEEPLLDMEAVAKSAKEREESGKGYSEEEKKQIEAFYESLMKRQLRPRVQEVKHYMYMTKKTLDQIYDDIAAKKSGLSNLNRSFLTSFERSFIDDLFNPKKHDDNSNTGDTVAKSA